MSMTRRRLLDDTFKKSVEGNPAIATDSLARMYPDITIQGWTEQDSTTGAQLFDSSKVPSASAGGATLVNNGDGSFTISGEGSLVSSISSMVNLSHEETVAILRAGDLYINAGQSGEPYFSVSIQNDSESVKKTFASFNSATGKINVTEDDLADEEIYLRYGFYGRHGNAIKNYTISPMIYQSGNGTWEPYTGGKPSPSPEYPQEIISSGSWDETAQKWEYEIEISNAEQNPTEIQTVTLTADRPLTKWDRLEKRGGQWGWAYKSAEAVFDGSEKWSLYQLESAGTVFLTSLPNMPFGLQTSLCDKYRNINFAWDAIYNGVFGIYSDNNVVTAKYFRPPSASVETVEQWKAWLSENLLTLWYETEAETFIPLIASEQEQMNTLHTNRPTTVLSNQQDCDMTLTYKSRKGMS